MEPSEIRRRVLQTLQDARHQAAAHRDEVDRCTRVFERLLPSVATSWRQAANVLKAEGHAFQVQTPAGALRFASERSSKDFVEVTLDSTRRPVAVIGRTGMERGHRVIDRETTIAEGSAIESLSDAQVLEFLLRELVPFVER